MTDNCQLPEFGIDEAAEIARRRFGLDGPIRRLDGERDLNFLIGEAGHRHVMKIANAAESPALLACQHLVFERLAAARVFPATATAVSSVDGNDIETAVSAAGIPHACRVLPYIEGRLLGSIENPSPQLLSDIGRCLARLDRTLEDFSHPALDRPLLWKMETVLDVVDAWANLLRPAHRRAVEHCSDRYRRRAVPRLGELRRGVIHNDANRGNLVIDESGDRLLGVIDFGDMVESWLAVEPAIAATYAMLYREDPVQAAAHLLDGYRREMPLQAAELELVYEFICMRLCMSLCNGAYQCSQQPDNAYLSVDLEAVGQLLCELSEIDPAEARFRLYGD